MKLSFLVSFKDRHFKFQTRSPNNSGGSPSSNALNQSLAALSLDGASPVGSNMAVKF